MKNFKFALSVGLLLISMCGISSCKKEVKPTLSNSQTEHASGKGDDDSFMLKSTTYGVTPSVGNFTPNSSSSITLPGISGCGSFVGGVLKAKVHSQSGSSFTIQISKQDGSNFSVGGTAYIKLGSVCGNAEVSQTYTAGTNTISLTIAATFTQGVSHFYPVVVSSSGGTRYYAEPLMVYSLPSYAPSPWYAGMTLATVDGVTLYASGVGLIENPTNLPNYNYLYQCVTFCKNYYSEVYGITIGSWGNANQWFTSSQTTLSKYSNGGSVEPRVGDILCLSGGSGGYGHVGIITEVSSNQIKMANQNGGSGSFYPIGWTLSRSGNTISIPSTYNVQGWLRKP